MLRTQNNKFYITVAKFCRLNDNNPHKLISWTNKLTENEDYVIVFPFFYKTAHKMCNIALYVKICTIKIFK